MYTPGTRGWSRLRDRTLAVAKNRAKMTFFSGTKNNYLKKIFFLHIHSSYAKILGETNFQPREFPQSGSKAKDVKKEREKEILKVNDYNGQYLSPAPKYIYFNLFCGQTNLCTIRNLSSLLILYFLFC